MVQKRSHVCNSRVSVATEAFACILTDLRSETQYGATADFQMGKSPLLGDPDYPGQTELCLDSRSQMMRTWKLPVERWRDTE